VSRPQGGSDLAALLGLGVTLAAYLVVGLGLGWLVDWMVGSRPVFILIGMALGIVGASIHMYSQFKKYFKE